MAKPANQNLHAPRYWLAWLSVWLLNLWSMLPWSLQVAIARAMGAASYYLIPRRRHIVEVNLRLCFPEWSGAEYKRKVREVLFNNMLGLVEATNAYRKPVAQWAYRVDVEGKELLDEAVAKGRGVLLLGAHYSHLDLGGAAAAVACDPYAIYRPNNNPVLDAYILKGRQRFMKGIVDRSDMRGTLRLLKKGELVWYPPDQDYGRRHSVYAPFFGVNAATITATSKLASFNQSPVLILSCYRDDQARCYRVEFLPSPAGFPSGDDTTDAALINGALEQCIRRAPTQYMWTHRRFKTQPEGKGKLYQ